MPMTDLEGINGTKALVEKTANANTKDNNFRELDCLENMRQILSFVLIESRARIKVL